MLTHFHISQQGQRHIQKNVPCQDYSDSKRIRVESLGKEFILAAEADGVGSCEFSQQGSETAVKSLMTCLEHNLMNKIPEVTDEAIEDLLCHGFHYALGQVSALAQEQELPFMEFDSTLTGIIFDGETVWFGHIGDDGVVALYTDGTYEMITQRHKGEEAHSMFPLREESLWQFGKAPKPVAALALMTDGVLDHCVDLEHMGNRVLFPFLEPALTEVIDSDEKAEEQRKDWDAFLREDSDNPELPFYARNIRKQITDDISFVVVMNSEAVAKVKVVPFDMEKWDDDTQAMRKRQHEALYAHLADWDAKAKQQQKAAERAAEPPATPAEREPAADPAPAEQAGDGAVPPPPQAKPPQNPVAAKPPQAPAGASRQNPPKRSTGADTNHDSDLQDSFCGLLYAACQLGNVLNKTIRKGADKIRAEREKTNNQPAQPQQEARPAAPGPVSPKAAPEKNPPQNWDIKVDE